MIRTVKRADRCATPLSPVVIRLGALGDMLCLSSLVHFLRERYGSPCVVIASGSWSEPIYRGNPDVAQIWVLDRHMPFLLTRAGWSAIAALRRSAPGPIYVCDEDKRLPQVRRLLWLSGVDHSRTLFISGHPREVGQHHMERLISFGTSTPTALQEDRYPVPPATPIHLRPLCRLDPERADLRTWLVSKGWDGRPLILAQPGNRRTMSSQRDRHLKRGDERYWPLRRWGELFQRIHEHMPDALIILTGAPQETEMLRQLREVAQLPGVVEIASMPIRQFFALFEAAHSMISIDTGPAHAAAASGLRVLVLFGAQLQSLWLPRGPPGARVIGLGGPPNSFHIEQISVDAVFQAWCSLVRPPVNLSEPKSLPLQPP